MRGQRPGGTRVSQDQPPTRLPLPDGPLPVGEFFTLAADVNGCVMVATGDTTRTDPVTGGQLPTARPLFTVQTSGPSLRGGRCHPLHR